MFYRNRQFHLSVCDWGGTGEPLPECFEVGGNIGGLIVGQAQIRHVCLRFHRFWRLHPTNQIGGSIRKLSGNECPTRHRVEGRAEYTIRIGDAGNRMAFSATKLLDHDPASLRRAGYFRLISSGLLSARTSRKQSGYGCKETNDPQVPAHVQIGCDMVSLPFSQNSLMIADHVRAPDMREPDQHGIQSSMKCNSPRYQLAGCIRAIVTWVFAILITTPACFSQQAPDGKQLFEQHCAECHGERGEGISAAVSYAGPSLQAEHNPGKVMTAIEYGPEHMPRFEYVLTIDQIRAVANYVTRDLAVIPLSGGNVTNGGELFRTYCATCHRSAVRGGALGYVGTNAPPLVDKSPEIIAGAIRWGPGPMPKFPPSVLSDEQVASIVDYIQTVQHPASPGGDPMHWYGPTSEGFAAWVVLLIAILFTMWAERGGQG